MDLDPRRHHQLKGLTRPLRHAQARVIRLERDDPQLEAILQHGLHHLARRREAMVDIEARRLLLKRQQARIDRQADTARRDQPNVAMTVFIARQALGQALLGGFHLAREIQQCMAGRRQFDLARMTNQQRAKPGFQLAHMLTDSGLGQIEPLRGAREVADTHQGAKGA